MLLSETLIEILNVIGWMYYVRCDIMLKSFMIQINICMDLKVSVEWIL